MSKWVRASYGESQVVEEAMLTTLEPVDKINVYNVYKTVDGQYVTVFGNQGKLFRYVEEHLGKIFLLRFLQPSNNKHSYEVELSSGEKVTSLTVAEALCLPDAGRVTAIHTEELGDVRIK